MNPLALLSLAMTRNTTVEDEARKAKETKELRARLYRETMDILAAGAAHRTPFENVDLRIMDFARNTKEVRKLVKRAMHFETHTTKGKDGRYRCHGKLVSIRRLRAAQVLLAQT